ncbi:MAG TPA: hypothetical protein VD973_17265 [Symbiobacteriaceae bacterium]|jgi:hypothetical protein|nr:hypothetical protein [Symbiobacteriaceae bacterium]
MTDRTQQNMPKTNGRQVDNQTPPTLDHGVPSLVAMDNPDDSQLGADNAQTKDGQQ